MLLFPFYVIGVMSCLTSLKIKNWMLGRLKFRDDEISIFFVKLQGCVTG